MEQHVGCQVQIATNYSQSVKLTDSDPIDYAYNKQQVSRAHAAGELGGIIKPALIQAGYAVHIVAESNARPLLRKARRIGAKDWAIERLVRAGAPRAWRWTAWMHSLLQTTS